MLPTPTTVRYQPLRSGLINLFKYEDQEFWYERGRLLVRGNNGTGKSRVLALQLPFLLDGEISPRRVEPDGDPARRIDWHLLMDEHKERTGYTWIEFGRKDEGGVESFLTLGCGMRAVYGGDNQPTRWFFVTNKRVGEDFQLVVEKHPLSAERLAEELGHECCFKTARDYRAEIDRRLFSLGKERYEALIELLIRLRAPQLSKKLDERALFNALSDALPPLSTDVVEQVAAAFKQLDELRDQHAALQSLSQSLGTFQSGYQAYLQLALLLRAKGVRSCNVKYEDAKQAVNEIERTIEAGQIEEANAKQSVIELGHLNTAAETRFDVLQQSSVAADVQRLDDAQRFADSTAKALEQAEVRTQRASNELSKVESELDEQKNRLHKIKADRDHEWSKTTALAAPAGFAKEHTKQLPDASAWKPDPAHFSKLKSTHQRLAGDHLHRLVQIDAGLAQAQEAERKLTIAQAAEEQLSSQVTSHREATQRHSQSIQTGVDQLSFAYQEWHRQLKALPAPHWSDIAPAFVDWTETDNDSHRVLGSTLEMALSNEINAIAMSRAEVRAGREKLEQVRHALELEREALEHAPSPPPPPATRDQGSRTGRRGAPLWQLCEFRDHLSAAERTGLEAALESAGLLDAWITPEGSITGELPNDTFLDVASEEASRSGQMTLDDWLMPDSLSETVVPLPVLQCVLRGIGAGVSQREHWVALDGSWKLGPAFGRGCKSQTQHLGASSREAARRKRLTEITTALGQIDTRDSELVMRDSELDAQEKSARTERTQAPTDNDIARALALRTEARKQWDAASLEHSASVQATHRARTFSQEAMEHVRKDAHDLGYGDHVDRLQELRPAWQPYKHAMEILWNKAEAWIASACDLAKIENRHRTNSETHAREQEQAYAAKTAAVQADETFKTLRQTLGSSVSDYQNDLRIARDARTQAQANFTEANSQVSKIQTQLAAFIGSLDPAHAKVTDAVEARDKAIHVLRVPLLHGLFPEAQASLADIETDAWSPTRAYAIARRLDKELPAADLSEDAWTRQLNSMNTQINDLRNKTGSSCEIESQLLSEGLTVVVCRYQGLRLKPAECLAAVVIERETHERLLDAGEREIIDRHLITEVSMQLQQLIENAQQRTKQMNDEMTRCATTLGVTLRLGWEPLTEGLPPGLPAVRKLLLVDHASWSAEERTTVGSFLHRLIQNERTENPSASAADQLQRALDYRQWHLFYAERRQNDRWERLTKKRYGTGSGGEKALMLTIPQMAAASAHYQTASAIAPRFILLDEAFAGMDPPTRARLMGLLEAFDLDLLMTSEREWGTHATVPGIAIYQLVANADAIAVTRWVWNGKTKLLAPMPDSPDLRLS